MKFKRQRKDLLPKKQREEKLVEEMFGPVPLNELEMKNVRNLLGPFMDAYFDLGCDQDED